MKTSDVDYFEGIDPRLIFTYKNILFDVIDSADVKVSDIAPSLWAVKHRIMPTGSSQPGRFDWKNAPYAREILDCASSSHPAKRIAVKKGVQIGLSTSMIQNLIGYSISENPNNMMLLVGHEDLIKDATKRVDDVIDGSKLRSLITSSAIKARRTKSGDTDRLKEFDGGYLMIGSVSHKTLRQVSIQTMIVDDFDDMKSSSKEAGSTVKMIEARTTAFAKKRKIFYVSTPELLELSNIEPVYLLGDQRKYHIPCPCCGKLIVLEWEIPSEKTPDITAGMTWELDSSGILISDSVKYRCQKCDGLFDDSGKSEWLLEEGYGGVAKWIPTAKPSDPEYYSYQISALYAPPYMSGWVSYVRDYIAAKPIDGPIDESALQTFTNLCLGEPYEPTGVSISANVLQSNIREYSIGTVPEKLSISDGNGPIIMITCAADINGKEDDARLDYEIVAHSEAGPTYSVIHGSIGTFIPKDKNPNIREWFTYRFNQRNSVWPLFDEVLSSRFPNDNTGANMPIFITGLDTGWMADYAYTFIDSSPNYVVGLKGDGIVKESSSSVIFDKENSLGENKKIYRLSPEKRKLYIIQTNRSKDVLDLQMRSTWKEGISSAQPVGFMNFPQPSDGLYLYTNYFSHFEAEHKIVDKKGKYAWRKKKNDPQNHLFDCRLYNIIVRMILMDLVLKEHGVINGTWSDYGLILKPKL